MQWDTYKRLCDQPDHWSRWMLEQCAELMAQLQRHDLQALLEAALQQQPLTRPQDHKGNAATEMYKLRLNHCQRQAVLAAVEEAQQTGLTTSQTAQRGLGGFIQAWREFVAYDA